MKTLGDRLKILRKKAGINQSELAERIGVSRQSVTRWETGDRSPDADTLLALAKALNTSTSFLLGETENSLSVTTPLEDSESVSTTPSEVPIQEKPVSEETGTNEELALPSGRKIVVRADQALAFREWDQTRTLSGTIAIAATLGVPLSDLVPAEEIAACPTQTHRDLLGLLKALAVIDPESVRFAARGGDHIEDISENDARHILEVVLDSVKWAMNRTLGKPDTEEKNDRGGNW